MRPIPVLMYHHISPLKGDTVSVTPEVFEAQMRHLKDHGFSTPSVRELAAFMGGASS